MTLFLLIIGCSGKLNEGKFNNNTNSVDRSEIIEASTENPEEKSDIQNLSNDENIIHFYLTPSVSVELVHSKGQQLIDFLNKETGLEFQLHVPKNYDQMIEDFGDGKADVAIMNSLSYVKANEDFGVIARLRAIRYGRSTYFGQIIVNSDNGIQSISDLQGKTIAYTDRSSTSGYLFPQKILREAGVKPEKAVFAGQHDKVVKMVYEGLVDAGATFYSEPAADGSIRDARARIIDTYPDVAEKVKIIEITEPIPNDPVVFNSRIPQEKAYKIALVSSNLYHQNRENLL